MAELAVLPVDECLQGKSAFMKKHLLHLIAGAAVPIALLFLCPEVQGQITKKEKNMVKDSKEAISEFIKTDSLLKNLFSGSYGYVVFPSIGKGAIGIGGASGKGILYQKDSAIGTAKMTQVTVGFQFGGQAYRELIFFQDQATIDRFKENKVEFSAQASAVAVKSGASGNAKYTGGIMIFTQQKGGLMYEASIGGQKFKYEPFEQ
jgi:lipid-binding SYLF domain-containing protein